MTDMPTSHARNGRHKSTELTHYPWPLMLIAAPAAVAIWSGWVGLGGMCGFGPVNLLPGVGSGFHLNTAITLPVGIEAYGAYALFAWLALNDASARTRDFARRSAIGALVLGCLGQVAYHLLAAFHWTAAPWLVVVGVACLPVVTLYFAATLTHLILDDRKATAPAAEVNLEATLEVAPEPVVQVTPKSVPSQAPAEEPSQPEPVQPTPRQATPKRKAQVTPKRISDADLKELVRGEFDANPAVSVNAAAKNLGRGRDRLRPLLEEIRREARVQPLERKAAAR